MLAEKDPNRRLCLKQSHDVPMCFGDARAAARWYDRRLDVVGSSPSCKKVSNANCFKDEAEATTEVMEALEATLQLARATRASLVIIEESDGLRTNFRGRIYKRACDRLDAAPYEWRHSVVDAAVLGAAHHRVRVGWVGALRADAGDSGAQGTPVIQGRR